MMKNRAPDREQIEKLRAEGRSIVFTNGCFDILHAGHVRYLETAAAEGDFLVVGVNSDESVRRLKGDSRPIVPLEDRMEVLQGLRAVDMVIPFHEDTPVELIRELQPDVLVKGADWAPEDVAGRSIVEGRGGRLILIPLLEGRSTTRIIDASRLHKGALRPLADDKVAVIIPARYGSSRFPGKPLALIDGKPMIAHVVAGALSARLPSRVVVATDDQRIQDAALEAGAEAIMTSVECRTGTDRVAEAAEAAGNCRIIVNLQGDEPLLDGAMIDRLAEAMLEDPGLPMATLAVPFAADHKGLNESSTVKIVVDRQNNALYFSRSPIPFDRDGNSGYRWLRHVGIYAYDLSFLKEYARMKPTPAESAESLEQLRALENGHRIKVIATDYAGVGVDYPEDIGRVEGILRTGCLP